MRGVLTWTLLWLLASLCHCAETPISKELSKILARGEDIGELDLFGQSIASSAIKRGLLPVIQAYFDEQIKLKDYERARHVYKSIVTTRESFVMPLLTSCNKEQMVDILAALIILPRRKGRMVAVCDDKGAPILTDGAEYHVPDESDPVVWVTRYPRLCHIPAIDACLEHMSLSLPL